MSDRKFLWAWQMTTLEVLVPKQRGRGWLKVPAGHHAEARIQALETAAGFDVYGLDYTLSFQTGYTGDPDEAGRKWRKEFEAKVFPLIEAGWKCSPGRETHFGELVDLAEGRSLSAE